MNTLNPISKNLRGATEDQVCILQDFRDHSIFKEQGTT